jgi:hypothetical protein
MGKTLPADSRTDHQDPPVRLGQLQSGDASSMRGPKSILAAMARAAGPVPQLSIVLGRLTRVTVDRPAQRREER